MRSILVRPFFLALLVFSALAVPTKSSSDVVVGVSVAIAPPDLPVYDQPPCPGDGYIWTPGYWAWDPDFADYYWVPGTWVLAPAPGLFWTPGYWAWGGSGFIFTAGYWGPVVGFYGGINYGFGYFGDGYVGGRWDRGHFFYNTAVNNVNVTVIHNTYRTTVVRNNDIRVSYNGGNGGIAARATSEQEVAARERHGGPVAAQMQQAHDARNNRDLRASVNHGKPDIAATTRAGDFKAHDAVAAREPGTVHTNNMAVDNRRESNAVAAPRNGSVPTRVIHPSDIPTGERPPAPNTGNPKLDQKYQQQQEKLAGKQTKENQKLQQRQDQEHERANQQPANEVKQQQMEQRHQQQTQQLMQRHQQENEQLQRRQQPAHSGASGHGSAPEKKP